MSVFMHTCSLQESPLNAHKDLLSVSELSMEVFAKNANSVRLSTEMFIHH